MIKTLEAWAKNGVRVVVKYNGREEWYGTIIAVDGVGIVLHVSQGEVCLPWHVISQVRPA